MNAKATAESILLSRAARAVPHASESQVRSLIFAVRCAKEQSHPWRTPKQIKTDLTHIAELAGELDHALDLGAFHLWDWLAPKPIRTDRDIKNLLRIHCDLKRVRNAAEGAAKSVTVRQGTIKGGPALGVILALVEGWQRAFGTLPTSAINGEFIAFAKVAFDAIGADRVTDKHLSRLTQQAVAVAASAKNIK